MSNSSLVAGWILFVVAMTVLNRLERRLDAKRLRSEFERGVLAGILASKRKPNADWQELKCYAFEIINETGQQIARRRNL